MKPLLIGLCGRSGVGKDIVAQHFVDRHGFRRIAVADHLKDVTALAFDLTRTQLWGDHRNTVDDRWGKTPRRIYQELGDALRAIHPDALVHGWREAIVRLLQDDWPVVVPDIRMRSEVEVVRAFGGVLWRIVRPARQLAGELAAHVTERASESFAVDLVLRNHGDIGDLQRAADVALLSGAPDGSNRAAAP